MSPVQTFPLPDPGEGLVEAEIVTWRVKVGDTVKVNDIVVEVETAKSLVELPVPWAGTVTQLLVEEGQTVPVGTPIIAVDTGGADGASAGLSGGMPSSASSSSASAASSSASSSFGASLSGSSDRGEAASRSAAQGAAQSAVDGAKAADAAAAAGAGAGAGEGRVANLVGYGPRATHTTRRPRKTTPVPEVSVSSAPPASATSAPATSAPATSVPATSAPSPGPAQQPDTGKVRAKPPVRKFAKDHGIDLSHVPPGETGIVSRADVEAYLETAATGGSSPAATQDGTGGAAPGRTAYGRAGERETRIPVRGVRKATAQAMVRSAFTAPHVTEFVTVDVTETMRLVERLRADREFRDVKVTPLLIVAKAVVLASRRNPGVNASWDEEAQEIVVKNYVNLGIAAATPRGLVVPNVKDADQLTMRELAEALSALTTTAREGRTTPADMAGGTITITNVGTFGIDTGTPILNPGESAILAFGAIRQMPWVVKGKIKVRWVTQLGLSFDHRLIDGDLGSRFLADIAAVLHDPSRGLVWG